jgi:hypothetical protein
MQKMPTSLALLLSLALGYLMVVLAVALGPAISAL